MRRAARRPNSQPERYGEKDEETFILDAAQVAYPGAGNRHIGGDFAFLERGDERKAQYGVSEPYQRAPAGNQT